MTTRTFLLLACTASLLIPSASANDFDPAAAGLTAEGAEVKLLADGFRFTEGPAAAPNGDVYFTDIPNNRIHKWDAGEKKLGVFMEESQGANGLYFASENHLYACQGEAKRLAAINIGDDGKILHVRPLASEFDGKPFNKPNDLWIDAKGGVYFSDPNYGRQERTQDGEHVYYLTPDHKKVLRIADGFERPNGLIGTADGKTLYISDRGGNKTYRYTVKDDGTLAGKKLFCEEGSDGMTMDEKGNVYLTPPASAVHVYSPAGKLIAKIPTPKPPSNVTFGGKGFKTLFITARDGFYAIEMRVRSQHAPKEAAQKDGGRALGPLPVYFYDIKGDKVFIGTHDLIPPFTAPSGGEAVRTFVFSCGDCSETFIGYHEKYTEEYKKAMQQLREAAEKGTEVPGDAAFYLEEGYSKGRLISADGKKWMEAISEDAIALLRDINARCQGKGRLRPCYPKNE